MAAATIKIKGEYSGAEKAFNSVKKGASGLKTALAGIGLSLGVAQIISGLKDLNNQFDEIGKKADRLNITTAAMQKLDYAAQICGIDAETVETAFFRMNKALGDAANGNTQAIAKFKELGLDLAELKELQPEQIFNKITEAINAIENPAQKTATVMGLFGRSGGKMLEFLNNYQDIGRQLEARGDLITDKDIRNAEALNDALLDIKTTLTSGGGLFGYIRETFTNGIRGFADLLIILKNLDKADFSGETGRRALAAKAQQKTAKAAARADELGLVGYFDKEHKKPQATDAESAIFNAEYRIKRLKERAALSPLQNYVNDELEKITGLNSFQKQKMADLLAEEYKLKNPEKPAAPDKILYNSAVSQLNNSLTATGANGGIIQVNQGLTIQRQIKTAVEQTAQNTAKLANAAANGGGLVFP